MKRGKFPYYLKPHPQNKKISEWIGNFLKDLRATKSFKTLADEAGTTSETIKRIEAGTFGLSLGQIRQILLNGYKRSLEDVLAECYKVNESILDEEEKIFERDWHYRLCFSREMAADPTPFLMGGQPKSFLWAVPFRKLNNQNMSMELLELAPARKHFGYTQRNSHEGIEVVHVINGKVSVFIKPGTKEAEYNKDLFKTDSIHFHSKCRHYIKNEKGQDSALLLVIRAA